MEKIYHFRPESENRNKNDFRGFIKWKYTKSNHEKFVSESEKEIAEILIFDLKDTSKFYKTKGTK